MAMNELLMAEIIHMKYEQYANEVGWKTQDKCSVPFYDLPEENKEVMVKLARWILEFAECWIQTPPKAKGE